MKTNSSNTPSIKAIDKGSVHQICSGQVVLDLATAVKELVENSLDANGKIIEVRLKEYGKEYIEVSDNGDGIEENDFDSLCLKHYTSKLKEFSDLSFVNTFGFRGEALSSLSALGDVVVLTQSKTSAVGSKLEFDHSGKLIKNTSVARATGTTITISNLFYPLPVRYKEFHRNIKKEFSKVIHVLYAYSLINNGVRFSCINQVGSKKKILLSTDGNNNVLNIIGGIFGETQARQLIKVKPSNKFDDSVLEEYNLSAPFAAQYDGHFSFDGYISAVAQGSGRNLPDRQFIFINNRPCDFPKLLRVVNEVYHTYNRHQYPFMFLNILVRKDYVDVNITPNKRQIMVHEEKILLAFLKSTLKFMFESSAGDFEDNAISTKSNYDLKFEVSDFRSPLDSFHSVKCDKQTVFSPLERFRSKFDISSNLPDYAHQETITMLFKKASKMKRCQTDEQLAPNESKKFKFNESLLSDDFKLHLESHEVIDSELSFENEDEKHLGIIPSLNLPPVNDRTKFNCCPEDMILQPIIIEKKPISNIVTENTKKDSILSIEEFSDSSSADESVDKNKVVKENHCYDLIKKKEDFCRGRVVAFFNFDMVKEHFQSCADNNLQKDVCTSFRAKIMPGDNLAAEEELVKHVSKDMFEKMEIVGQFNLGFIVTKFEENLFIVDQHATDEKYNFETLQQNYTLRGQRLIEPISMELTLVNESTLIDNIGIFRKNGFEFKVDNGNSENHSRIKLLTVPTTLNGNLSVSDVEELIFLLNDSPGVMCRPSRVRQMFASKACRSSVMVGTALDHSRMKRLVQHMGEIEQPWNCPHGRPTMRHLICLGRINSD